MKSKKVYRKPQVEARKLKLGVYGNYGRGNEISPPKPGKPPVIFPHEQ